VALKRQTQGVDGVFGLQAFGVVEVTI